jgi:hypothetical protein
MSDMHAERIKEKIRGLKELISVEKNKSSGQRNNSMIGEWEQEIRNLEGQLRN